MKNKKYDIVGIGAATVDYLSLVSEFPLQESVHEAIASEIDGGGPVATALVTAAKLGATTALIDSVGTDINGKYILQGLRVLILNMCLSERTAHLQALPCSCVLRMVPARLCTRPAERRNPRQKRFRKNL
jgi:hypothetical protein